MPLSQFHPIVARWFSEALGVPTAAQAEGWAAIRARRHTLIAAPTGSGKTLAAFLTALDDLLQEGLRGPLPDAVRVVYVSPLKALSADIHKNLGEPRRGIRRLADELGIDAPRITAAVRTGDTPQNERAAMLRRPPHILVTTPESLYLMLTAERSREMLRTAQTVIVDEIHAVIGGRRGAHLALSLERLQEVADAPLLRIGLSATQKPIDEVARFLTAGSDCTIVDKGHQRDIDLTVEMPRSALEAVMSHEIWEEYYDRLTELIGQHRTTLIFVNTRRMAERVARHLSERIGADAVTAHHGSLSKEKRLDAESRLKAGALKALVATASLELGIDIGSVDLVCQIGSPHRIATLLQRVGRSGHSIDGLPKGRVFPASRDDLIEFAALLRSVRRGELDRIVSHDAPLDVLAQQVVAESACREYAEDELFALVRRAWPYRDLQRANFDAVVAMVAEGFATKRGRRAALVHRDEVNRRVTGRRGARMHAISSGGAIPEVADYRVVVDPEDIFVGTLNEDFAIESTAGDVFQLGNASWRVLQVGSGVVRVADAKGAPPSLPFWLGEAPARSDELSRAVSDLRADVEVRLKADTTHDQATGDAGSHDQATGDPGSYDQATGDAGSYDQATGDSGSYDQATGDSGSYDSGSYVVSAFRRTEDVASGFSRTVDWFVAETGVPREAAEQAIAYLAAAHDALGVLPSQDTIVLERFFDESGGMQLVLHAPFGSRINRAWGLALRKRFCRQFNFELQAAATEDALMLSLGPQHSFPLADVFRYLHSASARDVLIQAFLDAPVFQTRWRWNTTVSLAVPRSRNGRKVPAPLQRMLADDLMAAVFPDAAACLENIPGDREIPDHPLVSQTVRDCLEEAMDFNGFAAVLDRIHGGDIRCVARDTTEPSPLSHEILNARPYAFLDDAPLEERRAQAVYTRRTTEPASASALGALDAAAIARVRDEVRPDPRDADELHDVLLTDGFLTDEEAAGIPAMLFETLVQRRRATRAVAAATGIWCAAERLPELRAVHGDLAIDPVIEPPASRAQRGWTRDAAIVELLRGRLAIAGPASAARLASDLGIAVVDTDAALLALESEGIVLRGSFTGADPLEWCERRLLARIHRYTLNRLRAEIEPVAPADFMRFLFAWQHVAPAARLTGLDGLRAVIERLDGFELAADAWERSVLPARVDAYDPSLLDLLCLTGDVGWARFGGVAAESTQLVGATPVALFLRQHALHWAALRHNAVARVHNESPSASVVLETLRTRGASFVHELAAAAGLEIAVVRGALGELVAAGLVASDGFGGLRSILQTTRADTRVRPYEQKGGPSSRPARSTVAGRWSIVRADDVPADADRERAVDAQARSLLQRYGVVFRRVLSREANAAPWRELARVYRRLEARGEIRGGRFVAGMSGEQFALPDAVEQLREIRRTAPDGRLTTISGADPLNLAGIITSGERVRAIGASRVVYRDGVPLAALEGDYMRPLTPIGDAITASDMSEVATALAGRPRPPVLSGYVGR